jgi:hypothetical protein
VPTSQIVVLTPDATTPSASRTSAPVVTTTNTSTDTTTTATTATTTKTTTAASGIKTGVITGFGGVCLDDANARDVVGNLIDIFACNGSKAQVWTVDNGVLRILGLCVGLYGGGTTDGANLALYNCDGTTSQEFIPQSNGTLYNPRSNKCVDDPGASTTSPTLVEIRSCDGSAEQQWVLPT